LIYIKRNYICHIYELKSLYFKLSFMASKKYLLMAALSTLFATTGVKAQEGSSGMYRGGGYDFSDTSLIPEKRLPQQRDFLNNQYDFPAKPRNQWEVGISGGLLNISGDVRSRSIFNRAVKPMNTLGFGLSVRKAWGYVMSTRLQFVHGSASGYNFQTATGYFGHGGQNPWERLGYAGAPVYYNYKTSVSELSFQAVASLNNLKFHQARNKVSYYALAGIGALSYNTKVDALNSTGARYDFASVRSGLSGSDYDNRKEINKRLQSLFDGNYETDGEGHDNRGKLGNGTLRGMATVGAGAQIRLSKMLSLQIEDKVTFSSDDLLDGQRWQEWPAGGSALTRDFDNINYFSVGLNINLGGKSVDPLWWMNPLDYGYNEMKRKQAPPSKCDNDSDGDGISDCFDRCPNTPGGVSVDSHGCPFDTDGDGVPDYKDKQLITPTECQPVDADGVGKCPDPECCKDRIVEPTSSCNSIPSNFVSFPSGSSKLSTSGMSQLNSLAGAMRSNPNCKVVVVGNGNTTKVEQQRSWDRVNAVINYMVDKQGVDRERFIFQYGATGDPNSVNYRSANSGEEGPSNTPPPFPNLRK
jgi:hypothetical protein